MHIDQLPTFGAQCVIVSFSNTIEPARAISKTYFRDVTCIFQKSEGVIDGRERDAWQSLLGTIKDLVSSQMVVGLSDDFQDDFSLPGEPECFDINGCFHTSPVSELE